MGFIDKKGKLFGVINIIDFAFLCVTLCVVIVLWPAFRILYSVEVPRVAASVQNVVRSVMTPVQPAAVQEKTAPARIDPDSYIRSLPQKESELTVRFSGYSIDVARSVLPLDHDEEIPHTKITEILSISPMLYTTAQGEQYPDPYMQSIVVKIKAHLSIDKDKYFYRGERIKVGGHFLLKTRKYDMNGEVIDIGAPIRVVSEAYSRALPQKLISLKVRFSGYSHEVVRAIKAGDRDIDLPDTRITRVVSIKPMLQLDARGRTYADPVLKAVVAEVEARVASDGPVYYYRGEPLKLGWHFLFKTPRYDINGEVMQID